MELSDLTGSEAWRLQTQKRWGNDLEKPSQTLWNEFYSQLEKSERQLLELGEYSVEHIDLRANSPCFHKSGGSWVPWDPKIKQTHLGFVEWDGWLAAITTYRYLSQGEPQQRTWVRTIDEECTRISKAWSQGADESIVASHASGKQLQVVTLQETGRNLTFFWKRSGDPVKHEMILGEPLAWKVSEFKETLWHIRVKQNHLVYFPIEPDAKATVVKTADESVWSCLDSQAEGEKLTVVFSRLNKIYCADLASMPEGKMEAALHVKSEVQSLCLLPEGRLAVGESNGTVSIYDLSNWERLFTTRLKIRPLNILYTPQSQLVILDDKPGCRCWLFEEDKVVVEEKRMVVVEGAGGPRLLPFSKELVGKLTLVCRGGFLRLIRLRRGFATIFTPNCAPPPPSSGWFTKKKS